MSQRIEERIADQVHPSAGAKRPILIGAGVLAICSAVYFSYHASPPGAESVSGTITPAGKSRHVTGRDENHGNGASVVEGAKDLADENLVTVLKDAASALGTSARELSGRPGPEGTIAADLGRAAAELRTTAEAVLGGRAAMEKSTAAALERQAVALDAAATLARRVPPDSGAAAEVRKGAAALERAAIAARSSPDRQPAAK